MKIYTNTFDLSRPAPHRFWVPPYSDFKIGIKLVNAGAALENDFTVAAGTTELIADETKIDGFTIYTLNSADTGFVEYTITVDGLLQKFKLVQIVSDSTVFDIDERGGDMSQYATKNWVQSEISGFVDEDALTAYYNKSETSSATEIGTALEGKQPAGNYLTAETEPAFAAMSADIIVDGDLTAYYTKSETSSATELAEAFAGAGGGSAISAFDMSENPVWSKTMVENALKTDTCLPQTIAHYPNDTISVFNIVGEINKTNFSPNNADKVILGSNISSMSTNAFNVDGSNNVLKEIWFSSSVTNVCLRNCYALTAVNFPKDSKVSYLNEYSFQNCRSLSSLSLPNNIGKNIPWQESGNAINLDTFNGCTSLKYLRIPDSVGKIARTQFQSLSCVIDYGNTRTDVPTLGAYSNGASKCYVPDNLYDQWIATSQWSAGVSAIYRHSELEAPYATSKAEDAWSMADATNNALASKVSHTAVGMAPEVLDIQTYYESEYSQLSVDDPTWEPDQNTMYVILPDQV